MLQETLVHTSHKNVDMQAVAVNNKLYCILNFSKLFYPIMCLIETCNLSAFPLLFVRALFAKALVTRRIFVSNRTHMSHSCDWFNLNCTCLYVSLRVVCAMCFRVVCYMYVCVRVVCAIFVLPRCVLYVCLRVVCANYRCLTNFGNIVSTEQMCTVDFIYILLSKDKETFD